MQKLKTQRGITLIALIITIIVMLILVAVTVTVALNGGLFTTAKDAAHKTDVEKEKELLLQEVMGALEKGGKVNFDTLRTSDMIDDSKTTTDGNGNLVIETKSGRTYTITERGAIQENLGGNDDAQITPISIDTDCVGYYVDLGGEEGPEGVIYIDIANTKSGSWSGNSYTITNVTTGLKEYYVSSEEDYAGPFGTKPVLSLVSGSTGTERFHVMKLEDEPNTEAEYNIFCWYADAYTNGISEYATLTGTGIRNDQGVSIGKINTENMLEKWDAEEPQYGEKNTGRYKDMWTVVKNGWYIPSKDELVAFGSAFKISSENYKSFNLNAGNYWSSSLRTYNNAYLVYFNNPYVSYSDISSEYRNGVRLGTTF